MPPPILPEDLLHRDIVVHSERDWRRDRRQRRRWAIILFAGLALVAILIATALLLYPPAARR